MARRVAKRGHAKKRHHGVGVVGRMARHVRFRSDGRGSFQVSDADQSSISKQVDKENEANFCIQKAVKQLTMDRIVGKGLKVRSITNDTALDSEEPSVSSASAVTRQKSQHSNCPPRKKSTDVAGNDTAAFSHDVDKSESPPQAKKKIIAADAAASGSATKTVRCHSNKKESSDQVDFTVNGMKSKLKVGKYARVQAHVEPSNFTADEVFDDDSIFVDARTLQRKVNQYRRSRDRRKSFRCTQGSLEGQCNASQGQSQHQGQDHGLLDRAAVLTTPASSRKTVLSDLVTVKVYGSNPVRVLPKLKSALARGAKREVDQINRNMGQEKSLRFDPEVLVTRFKRHDPPKHVSSGNVVPDPLAPAHIEITPHKFISEHFKLADDAMLLFSTSTPSPSPGKFSLGTLPSPAKRATGGERFGVNANASAVNSSLNPSPSPSQSPSQSQSKIQPYQSQNPTSSLPYTTSKKLRAQPASQIEKSAFTQSSTRPPLAGKNHDEIKFECANLNQDELQLKLQVAQAASKSRNDLEARLGVMHTPVQSHPPTNRVNIIWDDCDSDSYSNDRMDSGASATSIDDHDYGAIYKNQTNVASKAIIVQGTIQSDRFTASAVSKTSDRILSSSLKQQPAKQKKNDLNLKRDRHELEELEATSFANQSTRTSSVTAIHEPVQTRPKIDNHVGVVLVSRDGNKIETERAINHDDSDLNQASSRSFRVRCDRKLKPFHVLDSRVRRRTTNAFRPLRTKQKTVAQERRATFPSSSSAFGRPLLIDMPCVSNLYSNQDFEVETALEPSRNRGPGVAIPDKIIRPKQLKNEGTVTAATKSAKTKFHLRVPVPDTRVKEITYKDNDEAEIGFKDDPKSVKKHDKECSEDRVRPTGRHQTAKVLAKDFVHQTSDAIFDHNDAEDESETVNSFESVTAVTFDNHGSECHEEIEKLSAICTSSLDSSTQDMPQQRSVKKLTKQFEITDKRHSHLNDPGDDCKDDKMGGQTNLKQRCITASAKYCGAAPVEHASFNRNNKDVLVQGSSISGNTEQKSCAVRGEMAILRQRIENPRSVADPSVIGFDTESDDSCSQSEPVKDTILQAREAKSSPVARVSSFAVGLDSCRTTKCDSDSEDTNSANFDTRNYFCDNDTESEEPGEEKGFNSPQPAARKRRRALFRQDPLQLLPDTYSSVIVAKCPDTRFPQRAQPTSDLLACALHSLYLYPSIDFPAHMPPLPTRRRGSVEQALNF